MNDLEDAKYRMETLRPLLLDTCSTPKHNCRSASWHKRPTLCPPSPLPETRSINDTGRVTYDKFGLLDDTEEGSREREVLSPCSCFLDSQGRRMQLLCPPSRAPSFSKCRDKEPVSAKTVMDTSEKSTTGTRNGIKVNIDLNCVEDVSDNKDLYVVGENEVQEESEDRMVRCDKECSEVLPYLFLGSRTVSQKLSTLHHCGITHILNCVGSACPESFPNDISYRTLWLEDNPGEDLICVLYDVFDYIEEIHKQSDSRLFLHCCQGVSRSAALAIAYLMWKEHKSFEDAYAFVKAARCIASPNIGFVVQLMQWQSKIQNPPSERIFRMYRLAPQSPHAPLHLVPKSVTNPSIWTLDSRGVFIIQLASKLYIWRGKNSDLEMAAAADRSAFQLVRYEYAKCPFVSCNEGFESSELCEALGTCNTDYMQLQRKQGKFSLSFEAGEKMVAEYDTDYQLFWKAKSGGPMPPVVEAGVTVSMPAKAEYFG